MKHMKLILTLILLITVTSVAAVPRSAPLVSVDGLETYEYIRFIKDQSELELSAEDFKNISRSVVFVVNKYDIPKNSPLLKELEEKVIPKINHDSLRLVKMMIRGAASPEGPYLNNVMLAHNRARVLMEFINSRLIFKCEKNRLPIEEVAEDYEYLLERMQEHNDPHYAEVKRYIDHYIPKRRNDAMKWVIRSTKPKLWKYLLDTYFPELRAARVVFFFERAVPKEVEPQPLPPFKATTVPTSVPVTARLDSLVTMKKDALVVNLVPEPRREILSVKSNLLFDFAYVPGYDRWCPIPNVAVEYYPEHGHFTFGGSFDFPWWQHYWQHKYFQIRNYQLETRYYFHTGDVRKVGYGKGHAFKGLFLKAYGHLGLFSLCFDENRGWIGEGLGAGGGIGYVMPLGKKSRWTLELGLQVGFFYCKHDPFQYECPVDPLEHDHLYYYKWTDDADLFRERQYRWSWMGPTRIDITLGYDLLYRKRHKKGVSVNRWEPLEKGGKE